uniref:REM-1 domain-containing protein n=1 Tax=Panagrolaimus sp. ES5 TaxID=591445 RepID=A0AC34FL25_9BILA
MQFKASQKLLYPNLSESKSNENVQSPNGEEEEQMPQESSRRLALEKELQKELNVKEGFEKFFSCELNPRAYNHKLMESTRQLFEDNKAKITYLKMQIDRLVIQEQSNGANFLSKSDAVVDDLLYRLHRETALTDGALNMLRTMKDSKKSEKNYKELHEAVIQAEEKIDLIRLALKKYMDILPSESPKRIQIRKEIDPRSNDSRFSPPASYGSSTYGDGTPKASTIPRHSVDHRRSGAPMPTLAVSGKLELNIHGVQDLIGDIPGRTNRGDLTSIAGGNSYSDLGKFKTTKNMQRQYSQNARGSLTDEVYAILRIDNHIVAQTDAKQPSKLCWNHKTSINLDRVRELEIEIYYRDHRSMCAFAVLKLGNLIEKQERKEST